MPWICIHKHSCGLHGSGEPAARPAGGLHARSEAHASEFVKKIKLVSLEEVHKVVQQHIMPNGLKIVIAGDKANILPKVSKLGLPIINITHNGERIS